MSASDTPVSKVCPNCKKSDTTTFSKCRYCGSQYVVAASVSEPTISPAVGLAVLLFVVIGLGGLGFYTWTVMNRPAPKPTQYVGTTMYARSWASFGAATQQQLHQFDAELEAASKNDPNKYSNGGIGGVMNAAAALDAVNNNKDNSFSIVFKYAQAGLLQTVRNTTRKPLAVSVIEASGPSEKYPMVRVRVARGDQMGKVLWMNLDQLSSDEPYTGTAE